MKFFRYTWFPYLFSIGFPLTVYSHNQAAFPFNEVIRPTAAFLVAAFVLVFLTRRFVQSREFAAVLVALVMIGFWHFGLGLLLLATLLLLILIGKRFRDWPMPTKFVPALNILSVGVLFLPIITIVQVENATRGDVDWGIEYSPFTKMTDARIAGEKPDIYHIVLDAYGGSDALAGILGYDNSAFFDSLRDIGFQVNESVVPPYNETVHIMSSIFLGEYLKPGEFPIDTGNPTIFRAILGTLIVNGPVHSMLRGNGYNILYTDPGHDFLRFPQDATILRLEDAGPLNRFENYLGDLSGLDLLFPGMYEVTREHPLIRSVKSAFSQDFRSFDSPKFVYQHVLAPHTPFVIDRNGQTTGDFPEFTGTSEGDSVVRNDPKRRERYIEGYLEKLHYVNDSVLQQVESLRRLPGKKVIIVHGDHGSGAYYALNDPEQSCLRERFSTFLAVFTDDPTIKRELAWVEANETSLVNIYRSVYNGLLGSELELLPHRATFVRKATPHLFEPLEDSRIEAVCH